MSAARIPSIRSRLILLVLACVVPASILAVGLIFSDYRQERERQARDALATTRALAAVVDRELAGAQSALSALATSVHLETGDLAAFQAQAMQLLQGQAATNIVLLEADGTQRVNTLFSFGAATAATRDPGRWRPVFEERRPIVTDLFTGAATGKPVIAIAVPVMRDGRVRYALAMGLFMERVDEILTRQRLPPDWIGSIYDGRGAIVARTRDLKRFVGKQGPASLVGAARTASEGIVETDSIDGIPIYAVFSRSTVSSWSVAIGIPRSILAGELMNALWWLLVAALALLLGSVALASSIGGRIAGAIRGLIEPALALGFGKPVSVPPLPLREADEVGRALTEASKLLVRAQHQAHHDPLTGLANRALLEAILEQELAMCRRKSARLALLYLDLDGFKSVNDLHGHAVGDELLKAVAARLKAGVRGSDLVARLGGDEFAIVLADSGLEAIAVAEGLVRRLSEPYPLGTLSVEISASVGIAFSTFDRAAAELLQRADAAMYEAKAAGKRSVSIARG